MDEAPELLTGHDMTRTAADSPKTQDKCEAILEAALTLFAERGYHGTAMPELAQQAGVGAGTIYRYFESKEVLVNAVFQRAKSRLRDTLQQDIDLQAPPREIFGRFWRTLTAFARAWPEEFLFLELHHHMPYLDADSLSVEQQVLIPIWTYCVAIRQQGVARDMPAEALMALIWGAFVGLFKAEHSGYLQLNDDTLARAEDACWAAFSR